MGYNIDTTIYYYSNVQGQFESRFATFASL